MARKKCKECLSCFEWFWVDNRRYYHCWLCGTTWEGRDDNLHQCDDPRIPKEIPVTVEESVNENKSTLRGSDTTIIETEGQEQDVIEEISE